MRPIAKRRISKSKMTSRKYIRKGKFGSKISKNYSTITNKLLELIDQGVTPWHQPWHNVKYQNLISQIPYSGINPLLCQIHCLSHSYSGFCYIGKSQLTDKGWSIKKGSKANWLRWGGSKTVAAETEDDNGQVKQTETYIRSFRWLMVFNIDSINDSQSEHKIANFIPNLAQDKSGETIDEQLMHSFVDSLNADITHVGNAAYHEIRTGKIFIPQKSQFTSDSGYWATLFHELIHWTGKELQRPKTGDMLDPSYHKEELIADLGASFLGNYFGLANTQLEHHASYLNYFYSLLEKDHQLFFQASYQAQKAANYLLELAELGNLKHSNSAKPKDQSSVK